jgi:hypothetical protein
MDSADPPKEANSLPHPRRILRLQSPTSISFTQQLNLKP